MTDTLEFTVRGLPIPQGSARAFVRNGRAFVATEANRTSSPLGAWRTAIATEARAAMSNAPVIEGPVSVVVEFVMPRPRSHYLPASSRRAVPGLRAGAPIWHAGRPDADKLARALLDAITTVVIRDDGQVAYLIVRKCYEDETDRVGAIVWIEPLGTTR